MDTKGQEIIGVIGGSGIDQLDGLEGVRQETVVTPFGSPSDALMLARLGQRCQGLLDNSHVIAALIRKTHESKINGAGSVQVWGSGNPRREFIFVEDLADACICIMSEYDGSGPINIGGGAALSIKALAELIKGVVGYRGELRFDSSMPDGMPIKVLDSGELLALGWKPRTSFDASLGATYDWFLRSEQEVGLAYAREIL